MQNLNSPTSTDGPILRIGTIEVHANKAKIDSLKFDFVPDWREVKTINGATKLVPTGCRSESFVIKIEWIFLLAGAIYKDLSEKLKEMCLSKDLFTVVFTDTSVKTRCALIMFEEELKTDKQGQIKRASYTLKFKCESG